MSPAKEKMKDKINSINFNKPIFDIVSNVNSKPENNPINIKIINRTNLFHGSMEGKPNQYG